MKTLTGAVLLVGAPDETPDIRYITGFAAPDPVIYLQDDRRKYLVVPSLELERARRTTRGLVVRAMNELDTRSERRPSVSTRIHRLLREQGLRSVTVAREFPVGTAKELERYGTRLKVVSSPLFPAREIKTDDEVRSIRQCQAAAVRAMRMAISMISEADTDKRGYLRKNGRILSSEMLRRAINLKLLEYDCVGAGTIVACGRQAFEPHGQGIGPLRAGHGVVIDIFPRGLRHGYWGDLTRTVVKGKAVPIVKKMYAAVREAQTEALSKIRPGVRCAAVHEAAAAALRGHGFRTGAINGGMEGFIHGTGHGVGLAVHEPPRIASSDPGRLKTGHVVTVEPGLYYHDVGGVRIEDLVLVTKKGWQCLGRIGRILEV